VDEKTLEAAVERGVIRATKKQASGKSDQDEADEALLSKLTSLSPASWEDQINEVPKFN
jgi:hypothetical protein